MENCTLSKGLEIIASKAKMLCTKSLRLRAAEMETGLREAELAVGYEANAEMNLTLCEDFAHADAEMWPPSVQIA
jgi:hypothetical protein